MAKQKQTNINAKMNAGEQSFNHMPFTTDCIHELIVQQVQNMKKTKEIPHKRNEVMEKIFTY